MAGVYFKRDQDFDAAFRRQANVSGAPFAALKGLAGAESSFNPDSVLYEPSHKSTQQPGDTDASYGLMQVTGRAAKYAGYPAGDPVEQLFEPEKNVEYGARILASFIKNPYRNFRTGKRPTTPGKVTVGQPRLHDAIASYNMGFPRPIARTTEGIARIFHYPIEYREDPPPGWVYANQPYVDRVLAYTALFRAVERGDDEAAAAIVGDLRRRRFRAVAALMAKRGVAGLVVAGLIGTAAWFILRAKPKR